MAITGTLRTPQQIPNQQVLQPGELGSRAFFPLRSTPPVFLYVIAGSGNHDFVIQAYKPQDLSQILLGTRIFAGARGTSLTIDFESSVASLASVTAALTQSVPLSATIASTASLVAALVNGVKALAASIFGSSSVDPNLSGGLAGLVLTPETEDTPASTLTPESPTGLTLTPESPDVLDLE